MGRQTQPRCKPGPTRKFQDTVQNATDPNTTKVERLAGSLFPNHGHPAPWWPIPAAARASTASPASSPPTTRPRRSPPSTRTSSARTLPPLPLSSARSSTAPSAASPSRAPTPRSACSSSCRACPSPPTTSPSPSRSTLQHRSASFHALALRLALAPARLPVANALVDLYAKCNDLPAAHAALADIPVPDAVSFNSLLCAHARLASVPAAESLFASMASRTQVSWNAMVVVYVNAGDVTSASRMFDEMPTRDSVSWSVLIVGYCKCGSMQSARELFDKMPAKNIVAWTAMITGYAQSGRPKASLAISREMEAAGIEPDAATMVGVISAAAQIGSTELAGGVGNYVDRKRIERNEKVLTALVDMHAKCGNVEQALSAFSEIAQPDAYPYTALISGLATHGHAKLALQVFERMQAQEVRPDPITFVGVLTACSHTGLVDKGLEYWEAMVQDYGMERHADHYACVVDMLGRAGRLEEAYEMVQTMTMGPHPGALGALMSACKTHDNVEIAEIVANKLFELEPRNTGNYILLSNIYAGKEQWEEAESVRSLMRTKLPFKQPGSSWVEDRQRERRRMSMRN